MPLHKFNKIFTVESPLPAGRQEERKGIKTIFSAIFASLRWIENGLLYF